MNERRKNVNASVDQTRKYILTKEVKLARKNLQKPFRYLQNEEIIFVVISSKYVSAISVTILVKHYFITFYL